MPGGLPWVSSASPESQQEAPASSFVFNYPPQKSRLQQQDNVSYNRKPYVEEQLSPESRGKVTLKKKKKKITSLLKDDLQLLFYYLNVTY